MREMREMRMRGSASHSAAVGHDQPGADSRPAHAPLDGAPAEERSAAREAALAPGRLIFGNTAVETSVPSERGWPALALFAALLVGASCTAALAAGWGLRV